LWKVNVARWQIPLDACGAPTPWALQTVQTIISPTIPYYTVSNALSIVQAFLFQRALSRVFLNMVIYVIKSNAKFIRKKERRQKIHSNHRWWTKQGGYQGIPADHRLNAISWEYS
jgi:hypothetical protein